MNIKLIETFDPLIKKIAKNFYGMEYDDLIQVGRIGVFKAYQHYNNDSNTKASTTELEVSTNTNSNETEIINGDTDSKEKEENDTPNKDEDDIKQASNGDSSPNDGQWSEPLFFLIRKGKRNEKIY